MPKRKLPPNDEVIEMYLSGMSSGEIAEKCNVKPITVVSFLSRLNIPRRSAKEAAKIRNESGRANTPSYWLGKTQPKEMVKKRIDKIRGENHYLWKGGFYNRDYKKVIKKVKCGNCDSRMNLGIHHINLDHYDNSPKNLQVLCVSCHMSLHKKLYWEAKRKNLPIPKSNGPVGWEKKQ